MATQITQNNLATTGLTSAILSSVISSQQVHPDYFRKVIKMYGPDRISGLNDFLAMYGAHRSRQSVDFRHEEQGRLQEALIVSANVTAAGAGAVTNTITITNPVVYASANHSPLSVGMEIQLNNGITGVVTSIPAENTFTFQPDSVTDNPGTGNGLSAGDQIIFWPARNVVEGSTQGTGHVTLPPVEFTGAMQQYRLDDAVTDQAMASFGEGVTFFDFYNPDTNESTPCWTNAWLGQRHVQFDNALEGLTWTGKTKQTALQATYGTGFNGIIPTIEAYGNTINYNSGSNFQLANLEAMTIQMEKNNAPAEYMLWSGVEFGIQFTKMVKDYFPNGAVTYGAFSGQQNAIDWGFTSVGYNGRTFHVKSNKIFNRPDFLAAPGFNYIGNAVCMPAESTVAGNGDSVKYVEIVHLANPNCGYSMQYSFSCVDGTGMLDKSFYRATPDRKAIFTWFTQRGIEIFGAKQLYYLKRN